MDYKQKFEPKGNKIIHGAGQSPEQFKEYWKSVNKFRPAIYMLYVRTDEIKQRLPEKIQKMISISEDLIPQIGLNFKSRATGKSVCKEIAQGKYDSEFIFLINELNKLKSPAFIRLGYEFDNAERYDPKQFIKAWRHVIDLIRENSATNIATVWCACPYNGTSHVEPYYPGDNYVDWFGIDVFSAKAFKDSKDKQVEDFLKLAKKHKKPVMVGESSPARTGVDKGQESWNEWFKPYFKWINNHPIIKAFCYINWDWRKDWDKKKHKSLDHWLNGRIQENEIVRKNYVKEISKPKYIHKQKISEFLKKVYT